LFKDFADVLEVAVQNPGRVAVPRANNLEALEAVNQAMAAGILTGGALIGDTDDIKAVAQEAGLQLKPFELIEADDEPSAAKTAVEIISEGNADFLLKGQLMTSEYLKAVLKHPGMIPENNLLSHISIMQIPSYHKFLTITDVAVNIDPSIEEKKKIVMNAVRVCQKLGIRKPKVALQAAIEKVNPKMISTVEAAQVRDELREEYPNDLIVEGPYDIFISISKHAAEEKGVTGEVCGDADILLFHEINAGNAVYKIFSAFVPDFLNAALVVGAKMPLILPSRADPVSTKLLSIALAAVLMMGAETQR
jgi:phosphate butyryltransferase